MARPQTQPLDAGDLFPTLTLKLVDGQGLSVPTGFTTPFTVVLFYRGHWCPYCTAQLHSFQSNLDKLAAEGIGVIAASTDNREQAQESVRRHGLTFPVAYDLPAAETARAIGAFYEPTPAHTAAHLQSTGFVLGPNGRVIVAAYSTGPIGRLGWQDILGLVKYLKSHP